jgi:CHC2 zinc finger/DNA polymerase family A/Toprim domain
MAPPFFLRFSRCLMPILFRDVESRSTLRLADAGAWRYAADPGTEVLCIGYAGDDSPAQIWTPDQQIPAEFFAAARDPDWLIVAHNDQFESAIEERLLQPRYGWPLVPIERHRCTMAMAMASALPGALDKIAEALGLAMRKDADGHRLMMQMAKRRKAHKGEDPNGIYWHDDLDRRLRLQTYCKRDVDLERLIYHRLPLLSLDEQKLWELDAVVNRRGFGIDLELAEATRKIVHAEQEAIDAEIAELTGGRVTSINQVAKLSALLVELGHDVTGLTKKSVGALLAHGPEGNAKRLLELRQQGAQSAARKLDSLIAGIDADQRMRGTLRYHGASTGRWSGIRFQPQNLKKAQTKNLDAAIDAIRADDLERLRQIGAPLAIAGDISRNMITAAPERVLIGADFSAIESRVLAWLSAETWKLDAYKRFDETGDPKAEPYCITASKILRREVTPADEAGRAIGKVCDLAFGFGGGLSAWRRFDTSSTYTDVQIERFKMQWRSTHAATVRFWHALENCLRRALRTGQRTILGNLAAEVIDGVLYLTLPSGRKLAYPQACLLPGKHPGTMQIVFKDSGRGGWSDQRAWFGLLTENAVQAVARDLLAAAMLRLEAAGYLITLYVHDEAVCEVKKGFGSMDEFLRLMTTLPDWAAGLPIAAKAWTRTCYAKPQSAPAPAPVVEAEKPAPKLNGHVLVEKIITPIKAEHGDVPLADLIGEPLSNGKVICPFHVDKTPSLHVYDDHFHCFGCGARGDRVDWLMMVERKSRAEAEHILKTWNKPVTPPRRQTDSERTLAFALRLWEQARPISGTPAIRYLADVRGIDVDALPTDNAALRFHPRCPFGPGVRLPCLIALYRDVETNAPAGIHRIALTDDVLFTGGKVKRLTLGSWPTPRAIKIWQVTDQLFVGEGIETVLAAATRLHYRGAPMRPAWAAGSANNISKFPVLRAVDQLTLLVDHDPAGEQCTAACRLTWRTAGRKVTRLQTDRFGTDFNDLALAKACHERWW